ncbi:MAG: transporter [Ignavibacteriaceae bacterium]|nr:transporter [Ignavibacteriaceae bacterium]
MKTNNLFVSRLLLIAGLLLIFNSTGFSQLASPLQGGHYSPNVKNIRDMANPPSGLFVMWYNSFFSGNTYYDRNGEEFNQIRLDQINPILPPIDVKLNVGGFTSVPAVFWASNFKILGGANYMAGISPGYLSVDASALTERRGIVIDTTYTKIEGGTVSGFTDLFIAPVGFSWGLEKFDFTFLYGVYAPTGKYETGASDNTGTGFWTHQFQGYGYFYPIENKATAVMVGLTYELNSKIKDVEVTPGNRFTLEWGISQFLSDRFEIGVHGGHNWQISDDSGADVYWDPAIHDKKNTIAFNASVWPLEERLMFNLKYAFDFGMVQRFKNDNYMVNILFVTNLLTGN